MLHSVYDLTIAISSSCSDTSNGRIQAERHKVLAGTREEFPNGGSGVNTHLSPIRIDLAVHELPGFFVEYPGFTGFDAFSFDASILLDTA